MNQTSKKDYIEERKRILGIAMTHQDFPVIKAAINSLKNKGYMYAAKDLESKLKLYEKN